MTGGVKSTPDARKSTFSHANEVAKAHYYKTQLDTYGITAEIAPTDHAGVMRFTFPVRVGLGDPVRHRRQRRAARSASTTPTGRSRATINHRGQTMYFSATVDKAIAASGTITGQGATSWVRFATAANEQVTLKIGTSFISVAQATANLSQEVGAKSFDTVRDEAADAVGRDARQGPDRGRATDQPDHVLLEHVPVVHVPEQPLGDGRRGPRVPEPLRQHGARRPDVREQRLLGHRPARCGRCTRCSRRRRPARCSTGSSTPTRTSAGRRAGPGRARSTSWSAPTRTWPSPTRT